MSDMEQSPPQPAAESATPPSSPAEVSGGAGAAPLRLIRTAVAGVLMGTAFLIPGVSGGTMVLAMGLYQEFIDSVADITALRLTLRRIVFLGVLGIFAGAAILGLAKIILFLLFHYPTAMYALFIGLTLGGAPTLANTLRPWRPTAAIAVVLGFALMIGVLLLRSGAGFPHHTAMDLISGVIGATTMVLPGVSGSYMLLVMDQYERVVGAIDDRNLAIIAPVGVGAVAAVVGLSHLLKFLLRRFHRPTVGFLLGILLGSVIGLWPFGKEPGEKALERRSLNELIEFADAWQIPGVADLVLDLDPTASEAEQEDLRLAFAEAIHQNWAGRGAPTYTPGGIGLAAGLVVLGFLVTFGMSRRRMDDPGSPQPRASAASSTSP